MWHSSILWNTAVVHTKSETTTFKDGTQRLCHMQPNWLKFLEFLNRCWRMFLPADAQSLAVYKSLFSEWYRVIRESHRVIIGVALTCTGWATEIEFDGFHPVPLDPIFSRVSHPTQLCSNVQGEPPNCAQMYRVSHQTHVPMYHCTVVLEMLGD